MDDYMAKPFSPRELMARSVRVGERDVDLPPKEFYLLLYLARNADPVLRWEQILGAVWGFGYEGEVRTIDTHIKSLREHPGEYITAVQTGWGVGHKFIP